eukprot:480468-Amphidinium_carterae.1
MICSHSIGRCALRLEPRSFNQSIHEEEFDHTLMFMSDFLPLFMFDHVLVGFEGPVVRSMAPWESSGLSALQNRSGGLGKGNAQHYLCIAFTIFVVCACHNSQLQLVWPRLAKPRVAIGYLEASLVPPEDGPLCDVW